MVFGEIQTLSQRSESALKLHVQLQPIKDLQQEPEEAD